MLFRLSPVKYSLHIVEGSDILHLYAALLC
nr:MAG TPA: hypothetical protein [Caudoviricetes sp.]